LRRHFARLPNTGFADAKCLLQLGAHNLEEPMFLRAIARSKLCTGSLSFSTTGILEKPCPAGDSSFSRRVNEFASEEYQARGLLVRRAVDKNFFKTRIRDDFCL
jgi:hypothetical protein